MCFELETCRILCLNSTFPRALLSPPSSRKPQHRRIDTPRTGLPHLPSYLSPRLLLDVAVAAQRPQLYVKYMHMTCICICICVMCIYIYIYEDRITERVRITRLAHGPTLSTVSSQLLILSSHSSSSSSSSSSSCSSCSSSSCSSCSSSSSIIYAYTVLTAASCFSSSAFTRSLSS